MGKIIGGILGTLVIAGLVLCLLFHFGVLSFGKGNEKGDGDNQRETATEAPSAIMDEVEEITVTIVVKQDKYLIEDQEVTLTQVKEKVTDKSAIIKVILEDNYASTKAWDDIRTSLTGWGIVPIEQ